MFRSGSHIIKTQKQRDELLDAWEETYKKGQLTLWIFLALKQSPRYVDEIRQFVEEKTLGTLTCEEQSLYRTLRKYKELDMVDFKAGPGDGGPERKYYFLTPLGLELLKEFAQRNIMLFYNPEIKDLLFKY
ncbi:MAG: PadR family transcriptional regulator [Flavipsychrobacter sp.]